jgi:predicted RNase H-like nuclease (RuvC/YqgF family)
MKTIAKKDKITAKKLEDMFGEDVYAAIKHVRENHIDWPERPVKPRLASNHSAVDAKQYTKDLEKYETANASYKVELSKIQEHNSDMDSELEIFMKEASGLNKHVPEEKRGKLWSKAWEDGHSSGYSDVYTHLCELVDLFA